MKVSDMTFPYLWWQKSPWELQAFIPYSCDRDTCRYETLHQLHCQWEKLEDRVATEKKKDQKKSILEHCDDRRYLFDQGNEQTTGDIVEAAARPWCIYQICPSQSPTIPFDTPVTGMAATPDCQPFSHVLSRLNYYTYEKYKAQTMCKTRFGSQGMILGFKEEN